MSVEKQLVFCDGSLLIMRQLYIYLFKNLKTLYNPYQMGACTSGSQSNKNKNALQQYPQDIGQFDPESNEMMEFEGSLSNVKIDNANCQSAKNIGVRFKIQKLAQICCPLLPLDQSKIKWPINTNFSFSNNAFQIRQKFLCIEIFNEQQKILALLKINLYKIISGPYHHDFKLAKGKKIYGRLIFDLKISQIVTLQFDMPKVAVQFLKEYPGERFSYRFESHSIDPTKKDRSQKVKKTTESPIKQIPLVQQDQFRPLNQLDEAPSPTTRIKRKGSKMARVQKVSKLSWKIQNQAISKTIIKVRACDLYSSEFIFKLYRHSSQTRSVFCSSNIPISEILQKIMKAEDHTLPQSKIIISKQLYSHTKVIGNCKIVFSIVKPNYTKQITNRSLTEDGIVNMHHFETYGSNAIPTMKHSNTLLNKKSIEDLYLNIVSLMEDGDPRYSLKAIFLSLNDLYLAMSNSTKGSWVFYGIEERNKVEQNQKLSINILVLMSQLLSQFQNDPDIMEFSWKICIEIMKRGEMMLKNWGFIALNNKQQNARKKFIEKIHKKETEKIKIAESYCEILFNLLKIALNTQYTSNQENDSTQIFKVYCFFRIPLFQERILEIFEAESFQLPQGLIEETDNNEENELSHDLNWYSYFFEPLHQSKKIQQYEAQLESFLHNHSWFNKLNKKSKLYYDFVRYLIAGMATIYKSHITHSWSHLPGYRIIVQCSMATIKKQKLKQWSYQLVLMCISLIQNQSLFPVILQILYSKVNLNNQLDIRQMTAILSQFLNHLTHNKSQNGISLSIFTFPYEYFTLGLKMIIENSHNHLSLRLLLIFFFKFYSDFDFAYRHQLAKYFLGKAFWKLFYYWSYEVRDVFVHILILKIWQDQCIIHFDDLSERMKLCMRIINNSNKLIQPQYKQLEDHPPVLLPLHEQMRYKLKKKKRKKQNKQSKLKVSLSCSFNFIKMDFQTLISHKDEQNSEIFIKKYQRSSPSKDEMPIIPKLGNINHIRKYSQTSESNYSRIPSLSRKPTLSFNNELPVLQYGFTEQQLQLPFLTDRQFLEISPYFQVSVSRFKEVIVLVDTYFNDNNQLPHMEDKLQILGIKIDRKDIMPEQLYFDVFE